IKAAIERMRLFQRPDGGLSYWPGNEDVTVWGTTYAGHFMLEAEKAGYTLPAGFLKEWKKYQKHAAQTWDGKRTVSDLDQAYRLYTLAQAKDAEVGAMNRLSGSKNLSLQARWRLAAGYQLIGQNAAASKLVA